MKRVLGCACAAILLSLISCRDNPVHPLVLEDPEPPAAPPTAKALGLVEITISGITGSDIRGSVAPVSGETGLPFALDPGAGEGASTALVPLPDGPDGGIQIEFVTAGSLSEGTRGEGGQRYLYTTVRVRNANQNGVAYGVSRSNLTLVPVSTAATISGTPVSRLNRFDGSAADGTIAASVVPTGAVMLDPDLRMRSQFADVLQVFTEAEVVSFAAPAAVTNRFPYGFIVRNPQTPNSRTLPADPGANQFDGLATIAFRVPLQPHDPGTSNGAEKDPFTLSFVFMVVEDSETRLTESIEEQDAASRAAITARASALGATVVTVLNGSPAVDPAVPDYVGQRQLCSVRTAGTVASPTTFINAPGAYSKTTILRPGETMDSCSAYFRAGPADRPATNVPFTVTAYATDRYGNIRTAVTDTVRLTSKIVTTLPGPEALVNGERTLTLTYHEYGVDSLSAVGRRVTGWRDINVEGVTRVWTAAAETTNWSTGENWDGGAVPMNRDSVVIPTSPSGGAIFPALVQNVQVMRVTVENNASIHIGAFNLTAGADVVAPVFTVGGITGTSGRLFLTGSSNTLQGTTLPRVTVTGRYTLTGNVTTISGIRVQGGNLRNTSFRVRAIPS